MVAMDNNHISSKGLACSIAASLMFGLIPWYVQWLAPLNGLTIFWTRIATSSIVAVVALIWMKQCGDFRSLFNDKRQILLLALGSILVGIQWWVFVWAPVNGLTKELSLGYFLLPLTLVMTGRMVYGEQLRPLQRLALGAALIGVVHELYAIGYLSWVPMVIAGLYPFYFIVRRKIHGSMMACFAFENLLLLPFAITGLILDQGFLDVLLNNRAFVLLLPGLGIITTSSMLIYIAASRLLPVSLFGLLSYLEPAVIFIVALFILGESVPVEQWLTYGFILAATIIVCMDSMALIRKPAVTT